MYGSRVREHSHSVSFVSVWIAYPRIVERVVAGSTRARGRRTRRRRTRARLDRDSIASRSRASLRRVPSRRRVSRSRDDDEAEVAKKNWSATDGRTGLIANPNRTTIETDVDNDAWSSPRVIDRALDFTGDDVSRARWRRRRRRRARGWDSSSARRPRRRWTRRRRCDWRGAGGCTSCDDGETWMNTR